MLPWHIRRRWHNDLLASPDVCVIHWTCGMVCIDQVWLHMEYIETRDVGSWKRTEERGHEEQRRGGGGKGDHRDKANKDKDKNKPGGE